MKTTTDLVGQRVRITGGMSDGEIESALAFYEKSPTSRVPGHKHLGEFGVIRAARVEDNQFVFAIESEDSGDLQEMTGSFFVVASPESRPYNYDTTKRVLRDLLGDLRILAGDVVGLYDSPVRVVLGTAIVNAKALTKQLEAARDDPGPFLTFPSPDDD